MRTEKLVGIITITFACLSFGILLTSGQGGTGRERPKPVTTGKSPARKAVDKKSTIPVFRPSEPNIELVKIPAGSFGMGSEAGDADEKPIHQVVINYSFLLGKYEVAQAQWRAVMGNNPSVFGDCQTCPVENVSWNEAYAFISKLNDLNKNKLIKYRLPSEAEWEYACRAGTQLADFAGAIDGMAWYYENAGDSRLQDDSWSADNFARNHNRTHSVGTKQPNAWGLFDMHGNVWEWCEDQYHDSYDGAPKDGSAWWAGRDKWRVVRGGSYNLTARVARCSNHRTDTPENYRASAVGFRVAATEFVFK
jgi:formylglycine-generating enzyme required for sulfatase activity